MKKFFFMAGLILLAACSNESGNVVNNAQMEEATAPVTVRVDGFSVSQEDLSITRATQTVGDYTDVKALTLAFYNGETETYKQTQVRGSLGQGETFGVFSTTLPLGSYKMVVIARGGSDGDVFTLTSPTEAAYTSDHSRETFAYVETVNITNTNAQELSATLNRIVAKLEVNSTDGRTANVEKVRMTFSAGAKAFNPTTGLATVNTGFANTVSATVSAVGSVSRSASYVFLASDEQNIDVTIETLDADGNTVFSKTVANVPFKRNRLTTMRGAMYSAGASSAANSFLINTDWLDEDDPVNF